MDTEALIRQIIGAVIAVHMELGPGYLESVYETAPTVELDRMGLRYERQEVVFIQLKLELPEQGPAKLPTATAGTSRKMTGSVVQTICSDLVKSSHSRLPCHPVRQVGLTCLSQLGEEKGGTD